jgi:peptidoglycan/xylan/chitin deacetylase (PgdA/CDA1 family)
VNLGRVALGIAGGVAAAWVGYAWVPHLFTPACIWRGDRSRRRIALTFDDGPDPAWTPRILDVLAARDVRATFFVIGERAAKSPELIRAMKSAGHEVGNHSWSHPSLWLCAPPRTADEIARTHELLTELTGETPRYFRPPWGMVNAPMFSALRRHGLRCVFWSIQPEGRRPVAAATQIARVVARARPGAIVDLHDAEGTPSAPARLHQALPAMIDGLRREGYELATVSEVLTVAA